MVQTQVRSLLYPNTPSFTSFSSIPERTYPMVLSSPLCLPSSRAEPATIYMVSTNAGAEVEESFCKRVPVGLASQLLCLLEDGDRVAREDRHDEW